MLNINNKALCSGCAACVQICPIKCISLKEDDEGFLYPVTDNEKCINCGLCDKNCPIQNREYHGEQIINAFAAYSKNDEIRLSSSSGGIFSLIAEKIIKDDGLVFGAAFDKTFAVHHIGIEEMDGAKLLRGSKYLQSRIENTFIYAKEALESGRKVLYTGTPCQIAGLKSFLRKEYENLFTMDILCHGVPTPKLWHKYIKEHENNFNSLTNQAFFRDKKLGWKKFSVEIRFENESVYSQPLRSDPYMRLFLSNICLRPSCYECRFKALERDADITIGDAWGIDKISPEMDDDKGTSIVIVHTEKGRELFELLSKEVVCKEESVDVLLPSQADSRKSVKAHSKRRKFFKMLSSDCSIDKLCELTKPTLLTRLKYKIMKSR